VFELRRTLSGREAQEGTPRMRVTLVFCAVTFGIGCHASAAELGLASFYGDPLAGGLTAAHRSLPLGSQVRVVNLDNGRAAVVRIVGRGPFIHGRIIDVSTAAAMTLGFRDAGLAHVKVDLISPEMAQAGRQAAPAPIETSSSEICRYGADRLQYLGALSRNALKCETVRSRLFAFAQISDDLAPLVARGGAFLTETEAAASIPVSALAEVPEREASSTELQAAASIPVSALAKVPERETFLRRSAMIRPATRCGASCEKPEPASNVVLSFFARLRHIFD
jgi:rare lipoprotein A